MIEVRITMVPKHKVEKILSAESLTRSIPMIMEDLAKIVVKEDKAVNLDDAQKLEELGIELIRSARDAHDCCF